MGFDSDFIILTLLSNPPPPHTQQRVSIHLHAVSVRIGSGLYAVSVGISFRCYPITASRRCWSAGAGGQGSWENAENPIKPANCAQIINWIIANRNEVCVFEGERASERGVSLSFPMCCMLGRLVSPEKSEKLGWSSSSPYRRHTLASSVRFLTAAAVDDPCL